MRERGVRLSPWVTDLTLGAGVAIALSVVISADQGGRQQPDAPAYLWAIGLGALLLTRRRYPVLVLAVSVLGLFAYYAVGYPAVGLALPVVAALFSAAEAGRLLAAVLAALVVVAVSLVFRLIEGQDAAFVLGYDLVPQAALLAAAIALGDSLRSRRAQNAQQRRVTQLLERQHAQDAERRVHEERLAIARDLHDSLGHTVSVMSLHADVAREAVGHDDAAASRALALIKDASVRGMRELRSTVSLLRAPGELPTALVSLAGIGPVLDDARRAGFEVIEDIAVSSDLLPETVDAAAYRITQEAVTNAVRHSVAGRLTVSARLDETALHLTIENSGTAGLMAPETEHTPSAPHRGHGIAGMTERARALGGDLVAEAADPGFVVRARLPLAAGE